MLARYVLTDIDLFQGTFFLTKPVAFLYQSIKGFKIHSSGRINCGKLVVWKFWNSNIIFWQEFLSCVTLNRHLTLVIESAMIRYKKSVKFDWYKACPQYWWAWWKGMRSSQHVAVVGCRNSTRNLID